MGLALPHGGHLTHGMKLNVSGRLYDIAPYEVDRETALIDMDEVARIARERRPKLLMAGWSAYPRTLDFEALPRDRRRGRRVPRWSTWRTSPGSSRPGCTPARAPRRRRDLDRPQDAGRRAQRPDPVPRGARQEDRLGGLPGPAGRPAGARRSPARRWRSASRRTEAFRERQRRTVAGAQAVAARAAGRRRRASTSSRAAPTCTSCSSTCASPSSTASRPRTACTTSASRSTATRCPSTRARRWSRAACASARRRWPRAACRATTSSEVGRIIAVALTPALRGPPRRAGRARHRDRRPPPALRAPRPARRVRRGPAGPGRSPPGPAAMLGAHGPDRASTPSWPAARLRRHGGADAARGAARAAGRRRRRARDARARRSATTPLLGGLAILAPGSCSRRCAAGFPARRARCARSSPARRVIAVVGALDDRFDLPPGRQARRPDRRGRASRSTAGVVVTTSRCRSSARSTSGSAGGPLTVIGLVLVMNVVNFSDGVDGLAAGVCAISAATRSRSSPSTWAASTPACWPPITAGAALGFLVHNFHPARVFMGDCGSNLLGLLLGCDRRRGRASRPGRARAASSRSSSSRCRSSTRRSSCSSG